ncbi:MAG: SDR family oxidoreductase [Pseudomonadota bacterium]
MTDMTGKRALVTGAASGVGKAVVQTLAQGDAQVWALDIVPELDIPGTTYLRTDVSDVDAWAQVAAAVGEVGLDYLHLNAGIPTASMVGGSDGLGAFGGRRIHDQHQEVWVSELHYQDVGPYSVGRSGKAPLCFAAGTGAISGGSSYQGGCVGDLWVNVLL